MSTADDRRSARFYELSQMDLEAPLVMRGNKIGIQLAKKSALSVTPDGLAVLVDDDTVEIEQGSPWRIKANVPAAGGEPGPQGPAGVPGAVGPPGTDGVDGVDGVDGGIPALTFLRW